MPGVAISGDVSKTPGFHKPRDFAKPAQDTYPVRSGFAHGMHILCDHNASFTTTHKGVVLHSFHLPGSSKLPGRYTANDINI